MATGTTYSVQFRRKRQQKTNYKKRLNLLKSGSTRFVVRPTNKNTHAQLISYNEDGDSILSHASSSELKKLGWDHSTSNTPASYLTGLLCGIRAKESGVKFAILDSGLHPHIKGSKIYPEVAGIADSGIKIPVDKKVIPSLDRISGKVIASYLERSKGIESDFEKMKSKITGSR